LGAMFSDRNAYLRKPDSMGEYPMWIFTRSWTHRCESDLYLSRLYWRFCCHIVEAWSGLYNVATESPIQSLPNTSQGWLELGNFEDTFLIGRQ
jgi:hypothetical protein